MDTAVIRERRRLNDEIEASFITSAQSAANVEMKITFGKGNVLGDLQDFYSAFNYLARLTIRLKEMEPKEESEKLTTLKKNIKDWMIVNTANKNDEQIKQHCRNGLKLFDDYYHELSHSGVIGLPTRKG
jgi:hypothetical protein